MTDEQIIVAFVQGEREADDAIRSWVRAVVYSRKWTEPIFPEDIISETVVKVYLNLKDGKFRGSSSLKAYVQKITHHTTVDALRYHLREKELLAEVPPSSSDVTPETLLIERERLKMILRVWRHMLEDCRTLSRMLFRERLTYAEIAEILGITEGAVRVRVFRCKEQAKEILKKWNDAP